MKAPTKIKYQGSIYIKADRGVISQVKALRDYPHAPKHHRCPDGSHFNIQHNKCMPLPQEILNARSKAKGLTGAAFRLEDKHKVDLEKGKNKFLTQQVAKAHNDAADAHKEVGRLISHHGFPYVDHDHGHHESVHRESASGVTRGMPGMLAASVKIPNKIRFHGTVYGISMNPMNVYLDLEKARAKSYGHKAYTRRTKTGKTVSIQAKGTAGQDSKATFHSLPSGYKLYVPENGRVQTSWLTLEGRIISLRSKNGIKSLWLFPWNSKLPKKIKDHIDPADVGNVKRILEKFGSKSFFDETAPDLGIEQN